MGIENDTQQYRVATRKVSENATSQTRVSKTIPSTALEKPITITGIENDTQQCEIEIEMRGFAILV